MNNNILFVSMLLNIKLTKKLFLKFLSISKTQPTLVLESILSNQVKF